MSEKIKYSQNLVGISLRKILEFYRDLYLHLTKFVISPDTTLVVKYGDNFIEIKSAIDKMFKVNGKIITDVFGNYSGGQKSAAKSCDKENKDKNKTKTKEYEDNRSCVAVKLQEQVKKLGTTVSNMKIDYIAYKEIAEKYKKKKIDEIKKGLDSSYDSLKGEFNLNDITDAKNKLNEFTNGLLTTKKELKKILEFWRKNEDNIIKTRKHLERIINER